MLAGHLQIKNGYYYVVLSYMDSQGKRKQPWIPTNLPERGNKRRAEDLLLHYRQTYVPPVDLQNESDLSRNMLFADYMETWLETTRKSVEKTTFGSYSTIVKKGVAPYFRKLGVTVEDLQPRHLQTYYNKQLADVSPRTVHHYHCVIHKALKYLVRLDVIPSNPADRVELPKCNKYVADHYTEDELNHLFEVTKKHPLGLLIKVTAFYGLRRSEVLGLKWNAIDFENNTITIKHIVTSTMIDGKQTLVAADRAKTKSSLRTLPLLEGIKEELIAHREKQQRNKKLCGKSYNRKYEDYVFVNPIGDIYKPDTITANFKNILKANDMRIIRFHDLRHSCASLMFANDVPMKMIQEWLGHSDIGTTSNTYSHSEYKSKLRSAAVLGKALKI